MIKVNLKKKFEYLQPSDKNKDVWINEIIADWLSRETEDKLKNWQWAVALNKDGIVELDNVDFKKLYDWVSDHKSLTAALGAQAMLIMDECKEKSKKPKE